MPLLTRKWHLLQVFTKRMNSASFNVGTRNKTRVNQVNGPPGYALNLIFIQTLKYIQKTVNLIELGREGGVGLCSCLGALRLCMTP